MTCVRYQQGRRAAYVCIGGEGDPSTWSKALPGSPTCPNEAEHTAAPRGYMAWHEWATRMARTHRAVRCPGCQLWAIYVPKVKREKKNTSPGGGGPSQAAAPPRARRVRTDARRQAHGQS